MAISGKKFVQKEALKELYDAAESIWLGWETANVRVRDWERLKEAVLKFREARERK